MGIYSDFGSNSPVLLVRKRLTVAQIEAIRATPLTIVKGIPKSTIVPLWYLLSYIFETTPYTGDTGNVFNLFPGGDNTLSWDNGVRATGFATAGANMMTFANANAPFSQQAAEAVAPASYDGQDLTLGFGATQGAAPLSGGDGLIEIFLAYMIANSPPEFP